MELFIKLLNKCCLKRFSDWIVNKGSIVISVVHAFILIVTYLILTAIYRTALRGEAKIGFEHAVETFRYFNWMVIITLLIFCGSAASTQLRNDLSNRPKPENLMEKVKKSSSEFNEKTEILRLIVMSITSVCCKASPFVEKQLKTSNKILYDLYNECLECIKTLNIDEEPINNDEELVNENEMIIQKDEIRKYDVIFKKLYSKIRKELVDDVNDYKNDCNRLQRDYWNKIFSRFINLTEILLHVYSLAILLSAQVVDSPKNDKDDHVEYVFLLLAIFLYPLSITLFTYVEKMTDPLLKNSDKLGLIEIIENAQKIWKDFEQKKRSGNDRTNKIPDGTKNL